MKIIQSISVVIFMLFFSTGNSQYGSFMDEAFEHQAYNDTDSEKVLVNGDIYLTDNFVPGKIIDTKKDSTIHALLRYNAFDDVVEFKLNSEMEPRKLPKMENIVYEMEDYRLVYFESKENNVDLESGYYLEYYSEDKLKLIAKPGLVMEEESENVFKNERTLRLFVDYKYFIKENGKLTRLRIKKKDLKNMFEDNPAVVDYISRKKIKDVEDVESVLEFYKKND